MRTELMQDVRSVRESVGVHDVTCEVHTHTHTHTHKEERPTDVNTRLHFSYGCQSQDGMSGTSHITAAGNTCKLVVAFLVNIPT
jgi:hypothetical protein